MRRDIHRRSMVSRAPAWTVLAIAFLSAASLPIPSANDAVPDISVSAYATRAIGGVETNAEHAIIIGGILLERNRHLAVGGAMGCTLGAGFGAAAGAGLGLLTGGIGFVSVPAATAVGCGLFGAAGAALGSPLDDYQISLSDLAGDDSH